MKICENMMCVGEDTGGYLLWCTVCGALLSEAPPEQLSVPEFISDSGRPCEQ
jgi:hypothetical protein